LFASLAREEVQQSQLLAHKDSGILQFLKVSDAKERDSHVIQSLMRPQNWLMVLNNKKAPSKKTRQSLDTNRNLHSFLFFSFR